MAVFSTNIAAAFAIKTPYQLLGRFWTLRSRIASKEILPVHDPRALEMQRARARAAVDRIMYY